MSLTVTVRDPARHPILGATVRAQFRGRVWHVAQNGTDAGDGSYARPWHWPRFCGASEVKPDDQVLIHGEIVQPVGTPYLRVKPSGVPGHLITIRPTPGEYARLVNDGRAGTPTYLPVLYGQYQRWLNIEVTTPKTLNRNQRYGPSGFWVAQGDAGDLAAQRGKGSELIHCVVHDVQQGISIWRPAEGLLAYGNLDYYTGAIGVGGSFAHGWYCQPQRVTFENNITQRSASYGQHSYGEARDLIVEPIYRREIAYACEWGAALHCGGSGSAEKGKCVAIRPRLIETTTYQKSSTATALRLGYTDGADAAELRGNWAVGNPLALRVGPRITPWTVEENRVVGRVYEDYNGPQITNPALLWSNNRWLPSRPTSETWVRVTPSRYEPGRAHVAVVNFPLVSTVAVDLSGALALDQEYAVWCADDPLGPPILRGQYDGRPVIFPMTNLPLAVPHGGMVYPFGVTWPEFAAFIVRKVI